MTEPTTHPADSESLQSQALDWLLALEDADAATLARFDAWLAESAAHRAAFEHARACWQSSALVDAAAQLEARTVPAPRRRWAGALAMAASVLLVLGVLVQSNVLLDWRADHVTAVGQRQSLDLADGSQVVLNTDSAFSSDIDGRKRIANLLRGEAYFDVARDSARPFEVNAGPVQISVLGTAFAVRYLDDTTEVSVAHGQVEVHARNSGARIHLSAGDSIRIDEQGAGNRVRGNAASQLAWVQGRLVFDDRPLGEVLAELRRYYPGWIINASGPLDSMRVTGNYRLNDPVSVMRSLAQVTSANLHEYPALLILD